MPHVLNNVLEDKNNICIVIGGGPELNKFKSSIENLEIASQIIILGRLPNSKIQNYYSLSDIFINPTYTEGFPRVLLEAMASGLPIVTTDAGGIIDILGPKQQKFISSKSDRDSFSNMLSHLMKDPDLQNELSNENISEVKKFSTKNISKMFINKILNND